MADDAQSETRSPEAPVRKPGPFWLWVTVTLVLYGLFLKDHIERPPGADVPLGTRLVSALFHAGMVTALTGASYRTTLVLLNGRQVYSWVMTLVLAVVPIGWITWRATAHELGPWTSMKIQECRALPSREAIRECLQRHAVAERSEDFCEASVDRADRASCLELLEKARDVPQPWRPR